MYAAILIVTTLLTATDDTSGSGLVPFEKAEKWGFKDAIGKIIVEPKYDEVGEFSSGLAPVNLGAKWEHYMNFSMKEGGKWGYINTKGKLVVPITLDYARKFSDGLARVSDGRGTRYLNQSGNVAIDLGRDGRAGDFREGLAPVYEYQSLAGKDWRTTFIDRKGRKVFVVDGYAEEFGEGMAVLCVKQEKLDLSVSNERSLYGYVERSGKVTIPPRFGEALAFHEGLAAIRLKKTTVYGMGDTWGYIDKSGKYVIVPQFNEAHPFRNGVARVHVGGNLLTPNDMRPFWIGGEWQLVDRLGKVLKRSQKWLEYEDAIKTKLPSG
jgi:WG containing repeat